MLSGIAAALPLAAVSSQFVIGSFEARFFCARRKSSVLLSANPTSQSNKVFPHRPNSGLRPVRDADFSQDVLNVFFHGFIADSKGLSDFFVC